MFKSRETIPFIRLFFRKKTEIFAVYYILKSSLKELLNLKVEPKGTHEKSGKRYQRTQ
jgi:hypothetical protein